MNFDNSTEKTRNDVRKSSCAAVCFTHFICSLIFQSCYIQYSAEAPGMSELKVLLRLENGLYTS